MDGTKVIVFVAVFEPKEDSKGVKLVLRYNSVRKACDSAKIGFVDPTYLVRGLSVKSLIKSGGPIYGIKSVVLAQSNLMTKFCAHSSQGNFVFYCDSTEKNIFDNFLDCRRYAVYAEVENADDLEIENVLDDLDIEEWARDIILVLLINILLVLLYVDMTIIINF